MVRTIITTLALAAGLAAPAPAIERGRATGFATIDGTIAPLAFAVETRKENLFDEKKQDRVIVITDKPLGSSKPDDEVDLSLRARRGELVVVTLRIDGEQLVNVTVNQKGLSGLAILPGQWFQYTASPSRDSLKLARRDYEGHTYEIETEFLAARYVSPRPVSAPRH